MRRVARENVFKLLFEFSFYGRLNDDTLSIMLSDAELTDNDKLYINETYAGVTVNYDKLTEIIAADTEGYSVDRLYRPDLTILRLAVYELLKETAPAPVIINEAVELAKKYGTEKSGSFVNGVLARIVKDAKNKKIQM